MYIHIHVYVYIHTYIYIYIHTHIHIYIYIYIHTHTVVMPFTYSYLLTLCNAIYIKHMFDFQASTPGDNTMRSAVQTTKYIQVVIYDHITRRKT